MFTCITKIMSQRHTPPKLGSIPLGIKSIIIGIDISWYQPELSRKDAEEHLGAHCIGTFVFRHSETVSAEYYMADRLLSMSLNTNNGVIHFIVIYKNRKWMLVGKLSMFENLGELILYFASVLPSRNYNTYLVKSLPIYNVYTL
jgi:hypothetical protein